MVELAALGVLEKAPEIEEGREDGLADETDDGAALDEKEA